MCGIFGYVASPGTITPEEAVQASSRSAHRGPDGQGYASFDIQRQTARFSPSIDFGEGMPAVFLAHRRLAILDLTDAGRQPMSVAAGLIWITYNGEIYNFIELREELKHIGFKFVSNSDTEVILRAYEHWGEDCVSRFNGIWAFAIVDLRTQRLICSRDRFGVKPFHYVVDSARGFFAFGSEIKQLLSVSSRKVSPRAVYDFLQFGSYDHSSHTFFEGVRRLSPGCNLILDLNTHALHITRYYSPSLEIATEIHPSQAAEQFLELLTDAVRMQLRSDVPVGSCLSGGLDSSSLVCLVTRLLSEGEGKELQHTFSCHFEDKEANEREYMEVAIAATGVSAHFVAPTEIEFLRDLDRIIWHQDEPFGSTSIFAQWRVFQLVHEAGIKVMLDGQGADEQLAGYLGFATFYFSELLEKGNWSRLLWESCRFSSLQEQPWLDVLPTGVSRYFPRRNVDADPEFEWMASEFKAHYASGSEYSELLNSGPFEKSERLNNLCYAMTFHTNIPALLRYEDRNSMAWSVEARVPFLDHRLVEFVLSLPSSLKIRNGYTKWVLRQGLRGILPPKIRSRVSKLGFATPESRWQATILRSMILDAIADCRLRNYINPENARRYFDHVSERGKKDFLPWRWLNLVLWLDSFS